MTVPYIWRPIFAISKMSDERLNIINPSRSFAVILGFSAFIGSFVL